MKSRLIFGKALSLLLINQKLRPTRIRVIKMKKTLKVMAMVLFVASLATLTSCKKDNASRIIGKWEFKSCEATVEGQSFSIDVAQLMAIYGASIDPDDLILEFKDNGYVYAGGDGTPYSVNGDKLTITADGRALELTISELTSRKLTLELHNAEANMDMTMHFDRV